MLLLIWFPPKSNHSKYSAQPSTLMDTQQDLPIPPLPTLRLQPSSPTRLPVTTPTSGAQRRVAIAVDLSDESAYAVKWAVNNYLRPGDAVILLHVRPTSILYGADWGAIRVQIENAPEDETENPEKLEDEFDNFTTTKANLLAFPLVEAEIPYKIHIVKDHDMKERLCLEVERLGLSAVIMGSRGFGAAKGRLGSVSDYCVHHCVCPVIVVREEGGTGGGEKEGTLRKAGAGENVDLELNTVPEEGEEEEDEDEEQEYHDASDRDHKANN